MPRVHTTPVKSTTGDAGTSDYHWFLNPAKGWTPVTPITQWQALSTYSATIAAEIMFGGYQAAANYICNSSDQSNDNHRFSSVEQSDGAPTTARQAVLASAPSGWDHGKWTTKMATNTSSSSRAVYADGERKSATNTQSVGTHTAMTQILRVSAARRRFGPICCPSVWKDTLTIGESTALYRGKWPWEVRGGELIECIINRGTLTKQPIQAQSGTLRNLFVKNLLPPAHKVREYYRRPMGFESAAAAGPSGLSFTRGMARGMGHGIAVGTG